jgi:hypothetical protein
MKGATDTYGEEMCIQESDGEIWWTHLAYLGVSGARVLKWMLMQ